MHEDAMRTEPMHRAFYKFPPTILKMRRCRICYPSSSFFDSIIPVKFGPVILLVVEKQCMKKIFTLAYKRILPSLLFIFAQAKSFALDTASAGSNNTSNSIFTHPILWIAIIVTTLLVIIGPLHQDREYPVIMKKKDNSNKKKHSME